MKEAANILRWVALAAIAVVIALELSGNLVNWAMGLILVPLIVAFIYFWQAAGKPGD